jgi:hypothetical protein
VQLAAAAAAAVLVLQLGQPRRASLPLLAATAAAGRMEHKLAAICSSVADKRLLRQDNSRRGSKTTCGKISRQQRLGGQARSAAAVAAVRQRQRLGPASRSMAGPFVSWMYLESLGPGTATFGLLRCSSTQVCSHMCVLVLLLVLLLVQLLSCAMRLLHVPCQGQQI